MLSSRILAASCLAAAAALAACGRPAPKLSSPATRMDVPTDLVDTSSLTAFIAKAGAIQASGTHGGTLPVSALVALLPMQDDQRQIVEEAFPDPFAVTCQGALCTASIAGDGATATMNVQISPAITNPDLVLSPDVSFQFVKRGADGVEFCNAQGMKVKKFFVTKPVQGMYERTEDGALKLTVQVDSDDQNYTCQ